MTSTTTCPDCGKVFSSPILGNQHIRRTHTEAQYTCAECSRSFKRKDKLEEHVLAHLGANPSQNFACDICRNQFTKEHNLTHHIESQHQEESERTLPHHIQTKTSQEKRKKTSVVCKASSTTCPDCGKVFPSLIQRNQHIRRTHREAQFTCAECSKSFRRKDSLQEHVLTHQGIKAPQNFQCHFCHNKFTAKRNLSQHVKSKHLGQRTSGCSTCGKTFTNEYNKKHHEQFSCPNKFILIPTQSWSVDTPL